MSGHQASEPRRGQPLAFIAILVVGWIVLRTAFWSSPFVGSGVVTEPLLSEAAAERTLPAAVVNAKPLEPAPIAPLDRYSALGTWPEQEFLPAPQNTLAEPAWSADPFPLVERPIASPPATTAASHNILWMAAMSRVPVPQEVAAIFERRGPIRSNFAEAPAAPKRFSADGWLFLREGGTALAASGTRAPGYGRSQAGAVLRYRLAPKSRHDLQAYTRVSAALVDDSEKELAVGLSAKPFARLPLRAHGEARVTRQLGRTEIRPSAFVTTGFHNAGLPLGLATHGYGQAGYVGGDFGTAFADGYVVADREVARFDLAKLRAGAGAWGGAQKGVARLDVGPSASVDMIIGEVSARLSLDYRVRVAGDASPANGAALTLSTGF